jgi:transcriptional regulator with XRE-family HTH domain
MQARKTGILAAYLRKKRRQAGLTQSDVAKKLGYSSPQFVSNWERGLSDPPVETLRKISDIYNIPLDEIHQLFLKATVQKITSTLRKRRRVPKK